MLDVSQLPDGITYVVQTFVAPATMVWFVIRWFQLVPDDGAHTIALGATRRGCSAGIVLAALIVLVFHLCGPNPGNASGVSLCFVVTAIFFGAVAGILSRFVPRLLPTTPKNTNVDDTKPKAWTRGIITAVATAAGLAALVLYYAYTSMESTVHQWLMLAFVTLLCVFRLSYIVGE